MAATLTERKQAYLGKLDTCLRAALHQLEGAKARWAQRQADGLDDDGLYAAIGLEFGTGDSSSTGPKPGYEITGGEHPKFWLGSVRTTLTPLLQGTELVAKVRTLLKIPADFPSPAEFADREDRMWRDLLCFLAWGSGR